MERCWCTSSQWQDKPSVGGSRALAGSRLTARTEGVQCKQGVIGSWIQEGWVTLKDTNRKGKKDERVNIPDWWGREDDNDSKGFRVSANPAGMHYMNNAAYQGGWDLWDTTGDACFSNMIQQQELQCHSRFGQLSLQVVSTLLCHYS